MQKSDFIPLSADEVNSFKGRVGALYELEERPSIPELPTDVNLNRDIDISTTSLTGSINNSIDVTGIVGSNIETDFEYYAMDIMKKAVVNADPDSGPVLSATYGVGARLLLKIKKNTSDVEVNLPQLAAQVSLNLVDASISLQLKGLGRDSIPNIPDNIFTFSEYTVEKHAAINELINNIKSHLLNPAHSFDPILVGVELERLYADDILDVFEWGNYALWRIAKRNTLKEAFEKLDEKEVALASVEKDVIRRTYAMLLQREALSITGAEKSDIGMTKPSLRNSSAARELLNKYRVFTKYDVN